METQDTPDNNSKTPKRGILFLIAIFIGLLFGAILTLLIVDIVDTRHSSQVHILPLDTTANKKSSDTVVQYVIHKYEADRYHDNTLLRSDSLSSDTSYAIDETEDLTMDYDEPYLSDDYKTPENMVSERMLDKISVKITYLDQNKAEYTPSDHSASHLQLQVWESKIKNRLSYQFDNYTLKTKGLTPEHCKIIHFKGNFYLVNNHKVYPIHHNSDFERLVETHDVNF